MSKRRSHSRQGAYVRGFTRSDGVRISGHYRSGSSVSASGPTYEQEQAARARRRLDTFYSPLTYSTKCFWCKTEVYFYRDENGGCALFDSLGSPWPIHSCWREHQQTVMWRVSRELAGHRFDGQQYFQDRTKLSKAIGSDLLSVTGFVDRLASQSDTTFASSRKTVSGAFCEIRLVPADDASVYYELFVPADSIQSFPRYSLHDVQAAYRKHGGRWRCFVTAFKRLHAAGRADRTVKDIVRLPDECFYCGEFVSGDSAWGFDTSYRLECSACGGRRQDLVAEEYETHIATCHKRIQKSRRSRN
ncbi:hypothetical protein SV7mr_49360 [Stieleria bergensis]|uniref:Uncharacterized protein n=1 Tax=Stieleria bergensis TaxID=2528025 RepID=A0A517T1Z2_9BACT|nr:hypothetical protein SV7mr_49360 [Planctomycetes bacterium SV_7m_r]